MVDFSMDDGVVNLQLLQCEQQEMQQRLEALMDRHALLRHGWQRRYTRYQQLPAKNAMGYWIEQQADLTLQSLPRFIEQMPQTSYSFVSSAEVAPTERQDYWHKQIATRAFESTQARFDDLVGVERYYQYFSIKASVAADSSRALFLDLVQLLRPVFCHHSPAYLQGNVPDPDLALNLCLERSAGFLAGDKPPEWQWAQQHFDIFPKLDFNGAGRFKHKRTAPERLGWLNCWSPDICALLGFPDAELDRNLLPRCQQLPTGHWIVALTEEPLDLRRPDHVQAMAWAYLRFGQIGARKSSAPAATRTKRRAAPEPAMQATTALQEFQIYERDTAGQWWTSNFAPVQACDGEQALRIFFARHSYSRQPKPRIAGPAAPRLRRYCRRSTLAAQRLL